MLKKQNWGTEKLIKLSKQVSCRAVSLPLWVQGRKHEQEKWARFWRWAGWWGWWWCGASIPYLAQTPLTSSPCGQAGKWPNLLASFPGMQTICKVNFRRLTKVKKYSVTHMRLISAIGELHVSGHKFLPIQAKTIGSGQNENSRFQVMNKMGCAGFSPFSFGSKNVLFLFSQVTNICLWPSS